MGHTACTEPQCLYKGDLYLFTSFISLLVIFIVLVLMADSDFLVCQLPILEAGTFSAGQEAFCSAGTKIFVTWESSVLYVIVDTSLQTVLSQHIS
jgi:hypothetical protein